MEKRSFTRINAFQDNIAQGNPISGDAAPARAIYTFAKMAWCTTARSSADIREFRWRSTQRRYPPRIPHRKILRAALHRFVRASGVHLRFLARTAVSFSARYCTS